MRSIVLHLTAYGTVIALAVGACLHVSWCWWTLVGLLIVGEAVLPDPPGPRRYP
jgi:hypothetical protein